ncbi:MULTISPECIES: GntR family transcriptional regulator [Bacillaceae]|uniref:GntR family transcriptional regulator n=1 Tax=Evansella alkalicola TaxID=745819 RepID=A0ABS6JTT6_9BACI|nr:MULTISPECIES: GntR family transcriptional regulator [Bacillaceae]MBU9720657.1 GntR family transcriptional regulator [Bacillus alkalicola]
MWIHLNDEDARPLYVQVKEQLIREILNGSLQPGEELPSIRRLAKEARTSVITVKRAYQDLEQEGYIFTRAGKGSYVKLQLDDERKNMKKRQFKEKTDELLVFGKQLHLSNDDMRQIMRKCLEEGER